MFILSNFGAGKGYLPPIHKAFSIPGLPFFPDVLHVTVFAYMGFHPKNWEKVTATFSVKSIMWKCSFWTILGLGKATPHP